MFQNDFIEQSSPSEAAQSQAGQVLSHVSLFYKLFSLQCDSLQDYKNPLILC
jgi:hypothetical protein